VRLVTSSGDDVFDAAIIDDVGRWHYEPFASPRLACERTTVTFVP
jgi:outer membrane biosynthesis protein TonB